MLMRLALYFFIYAFIGWLLESVYAVYIHKKFINRGFLNGPICPMYGVAMVMIILLSRWLGDNLVLFYLSVVILASALEYVTGWLLEVVFKTRYWDYSDKALNLHGRICLTFSAFWGLAAVLIMRFVHPFIASVADYVPTDALNWTVGILLGILAADISVSVATALKLRDRLGRIYEFLQSLSQSVKDPHFYEAMHNETQESPQEWKERMEQSLDELKVRTQEAMEGSKSVSEGTVDDLLSHFKKLFTGPNVLQRRLINAFPHVKDKVYPKLKDSVAPAPKGVFPAPSESRQQDQQ